VGRKGGKEGGKKGREGGWEGGGKEGGWEEGKESGREKGGMEGGEELDRGGIDAGQQIMHRERNGDLRGEEWEGEGGRKAITRRYAG